MVAIASAGMVNPWSMKRDKQLICVDSWRASAHNPNQVLSVAQLNRSIRLPQMPPLYQKCTMGEMRLATMAG
jgi:hypothetical protein